ncbi:thiamine-repressible mitochondrial transport protein THI74 [Arachis ipaensis]|uniref:thiamine-repressible mitochondrial transport protein THI74 n=1 Tax=Arachis ipaensis TaxID=130454 RepID=UPI0007AEFA0C|nr:thiamine-repressible mitochondrial transport protein THI74 [Arachis ipaensis]
MASKVENSKAWKWGLGLVYIVAVATIWIAASFVVQSVVDGGVSPFLVTYICNSLFVVLIPIVEIGRYLEDSCGGGCFWSAKKASQHSESVGESEQAILLEENDVGNEGNESLVVDEEVGISEQRNSGSIFLPPENRVEVLPGQVNVIENVDNQLDEKGRWTRWRVAKVSLLICPFWFLAQLTFNLSLKYTTVTSNTILSSASSLFTFLVSLAFLGERFTWLKLFSVLNILIFLPIALILNFTKVEPFHTLTLKQLGLIIGKGLFDNVLSDYLWAKAVLLTSTTVATAGLTIQVPLAAIVDTLTGRAPRLMNYLGAIAVMVGFAGINIPLETLCNKREANIELENNVSLGKEEFTIPRGEDSAAIP